MQKTTIERTLTQLDHVRLKKMADQLVAQAAGRHDADAEALEDLLAVSELLPSREIPADLVTMYTKVQLEDSASGERYQLAVCYPRDADPAKGCVSVLSPVGMALIGVRKGALVQWQAPEGAAASVRVIDIVFQPEASGDYLT